MKTVTAFIVGSVSTVAIAASAIAFAGPGGCDRGGEGYGPGSYKEHRMGHKGMMGERMVKKMTRKLDLTEDQQANLQALVDQMKAKREAKREDRGEKKAEMLTLLDGATLDQAKMVDSINARIAERQEGVKDMVAAVAQFTDSLTPEQRATLKEHLEKRGGRGFGF